jgi:hypothetical protein
MLWKDDAVPLTHDDYEVASEDFLRAVRSTPEVLGVWQIGSVSVPGISDLDFILVIREGARLSWQQMRKRLSPETLRLLLHSPTALPESLFVWLNYLTDTRGIRRLIGPELRLAEPGNRRLLNLITAARLTMAKLMGLKRTWFIGASGIRSFLSRVNSLRHNFTLMEKHVPPAVEEASDLRASWFRMGEERFGRLDELLSGAIEACVGLLREAEVPCRLESGSDELVAENWRFYGGNGMTEKRGILSWLPRKGRLGELAYYSARFELGIAPGLSGLLAGTLAPEEGREDWERHQKLLARCEEARLRLPGFSAAAPLLSPRGWRRWIP